jgi:flagellar motor protein MotB
MRAKIAAYLADKKARYTVTIIGFTEGPTVLPVDKALAAARAKNASIAVQRLLGDRAVEIKLASRPLSVKGDKNRRIEIVLRKVN